MPKRIFSWIGLVVVCAIGAGRISVAAEREFVGVLALALDSSVASELKLSPDQKSKLVALVNERETAATDLVLTIKDLPSDEQAVKLAPLREAAERAGLEILSPEQRKRLEQIRLERQGLAALSEPKIAAALKLTAEQQKQAAELLAQRGAPPGADDVARRKAQVELERQLAALLSNEQRAAWDGLAGRNGDAEDDAPEAEAKPEAKPAAEGKPLVEAKPGPESKPGPGFRPAVGADDKPAGDKPSGERGEKKVVKSADGLLRFNFRFQPWKDVLDWFSEQADLSLIMEGPPPGTFNYQDDRGYTPGEAINLINGVLLTKGYTLIRRERMLMLVNLADGIPPNLVPYVSLDDLDARGDNELVSVAFRLSKLSPEEAEAEIKKLLGPQGSVVVLSKARQIVVTETAGRLRTVRAVIQGVEDPEAIGSEDVHAFELDHSSANEALTILRQLFNIPLDKNATTDGSLRLAVDAFGGRVLASGKPDAIARVKQVLSEIDKPLGGTGTTGINESPQLEIYGVSGADPQSALAVLQTLLSGMPDVRLAIDPLSGKLVAMARPSQHATIRATIAQMQRDGRQLAVIRLRTVDPLSAVTTINKLFAGQGETAGGGPKVEAEPTSRQLIVRGSQEEISQIQKLLEDMGELAVGPTLTQSRGNVRMIPLSGRVAERALEQIKQVWPTMHKNKIRMVTPSSGIPSVRPSAPPETDASSDPEARRTPLPTPAARPEPEARKPDRTVPAESLRSTSRPVGVQFRFADQQVPVEENVGKAEAPQEAVVPEATPAQPEKAAVPPADEKPAPREDGKSADIIVAPGTGGVMIASEDTQVLDDFEALLTTLGNRSFAGGREYTVFYLKYAKANTVAELLDQIFGGGGSGGGGGSLIGDIAGAAFGGFGGGIVGDMLGGGGGSSTSSGAVAIVPDMRLNALVVQAKPVDLDTIEQLLKVLDQKNGPEEVEVKARPKLIPVINTSADSMAEVVRQVYADRLNTGGGQGRQPNPEEFIRMLRGGRGGDSRRRSETETDKMTIGVDPRSNSLVVAAPDSLFEEVKELVVQLDQSYSEASQVATKVVTLNFASTQAVQQALSAIVGPTTRNNTTSSSSRTNNSQSGQNQGMEAFRGFGGPFGGGFGGPFGGGFGGPFGGGGEGFRGGRGEGFRGGGEGFRGGRGGEGRGEGRGGGEGRGEGRRGGGD